jgi:hypothetical protein
MLREKDTSSAEKDKILLELMDARRRNKGSLV